MSHNDLLHDIQGKKKVAILFVCLGNICRSPAADGIMQHIIEQRGTEALFTIDSAGLYSGHAGELPDHRMRVHAIRRGYNLIHRSRPVRSSDFDNFDIIVAMDDSNYHRLRDMAPTIDDERKIVRMATYVRAYPFVDCIPDPYYDGAEGFERVLDLLEDSCTVLHDTIVEAMRRND